MRVEIPLKTPLLFSSFLIYLYLRRRFNYVGRPRARFLRVAAKTHVGGVCFDVCCTLCKQQFSRRAARSAHSGNRLCASLLDVCMALT
jgi:hypothetical protein